MPILKPRRPRAWDHLIGFGSYAMKTAGWLVIHVPHYAKWLLKQPAKGPMQLAQKYVRATVDAFDKVSFRVKCQMITEHGSCVNPADYARSCISDPGCEFYCEECRPSPPSNHGTDYMYIRTYEDALVCKVLQGTTWSMAQFIEAKTGELEDTDDACRAFFDANVPKEDVLEEEPPASVTNDCKTLE